jgi:predicted protein tyrosine phosphatase
MIELHYLEKIVMSQIQNMSLIAVCKQLRQDNIDGDVHHVIRILDKHEDFVFSEFPIVAYPNAMIHEFRFNDSEYRDSITENQADEIADILKKVVENNENVIVHCVMGKQRSGAVAQAAVAMFPEFEYRGNAVSQSAHVKSMILNSLGYYAQYN